MPKISAQDIINILQIDAKNLQGQAAKIKDPTARVVVTEIGRRLQSNAESLQKMLDASNEFDRDDKTPLINTFDPQDEPTPRAPTSLTDPPKIKTDPED